MSKLKYLPLLFVCLLVSSGLHAQFMNYGSDPARFKWNIVRLPHYNLVYPPWPTAMPSTWKMLIRTYKKQSENP